MLDAVCPKGRVQKVPVSFKTTTVLAGDMQVHPRTDLGGQQTLLQEFQPEDPRELLVQILLGPVDGLESLRRRDLFLP